MLFYHIWTLPILTNIYVAKTKQRMADTHLSIETTYIAYPICYTMMLPNMPFRKADAHPLRLNTRCKDLTLVPSISINVNHHSENVLFVFERLAGKKKGRGDALGFVGNTSVRFREAFARNSMLSHLGRLRDSSGFSKPFPFTKSRTFVVIPLLRLALLVGLPLVVAVGPLIFLSLFSDHFQFSLINLLFIV